MKDFFTKLNQNIGLIALVALCTTVATTAVLDTPQWDGNMVQAPVELVQFTK